VTVVPHIVPQSGTTPAERFLLFTAVTTLPLEKHLPTVAGMSFSFLVFAVLAAYIIVNRPRLLSEIWYHPVFIAAYTFVVVSALLEYSSPLSSYQEIIRFAQMIGGAVCVATLCRDRSGLAVGLYGYIGAALWVSILLYLTSYGMLREMGATSSFQEASNLRGHLDTGITANKNALAFVCTQGAIVAFALSLSDRFKHFHILLLGIGIFCLVAAFLPMSRGAVVIGSVSGATILHAYGVKQGKALILASILGMGIYILVPDAVWSRMAFSTEVGESGRMEARAHVYTTALNRLPEYIIAGVGAGNYYAQWGLEKGFFSSRGVVGAHNALLQIAIFWGGLALFMYLWFIWLVYRSIPLRCGRDELSLALLGVLVSLGMIILESHSFYDKWFAFGIGMLLGARQWIWPTGIVSAVEDNKCPPHARSSADCPSR
jgi:hypothetical protein